MSDVEHVSDLRWDRLLAGELSAEQASAAREHASACARCAARLAELTAGRDAFAVPMQVVALKPRKRAVWIAAAAAVAAAAVLILVVRPRSDPEERTKGGGPDLVLAAGRESNLVPVSSGDVVRAGDSLQAAYTSTRDGYGAVIARDGAAGVFAYVPSSGDAMLALPAGENRSFPQSTRLDDVVGRELVFVVWCERPHTVSPLLDQLRATGDIVAPDGCTLRRVELTKQARP